MSVLAFPCEQVRHHLRAPPEQSIDEWAEENIHIPFGGERGPFSLERAPFAREVLRMIKHPDVEEIALMFAAQIAKTIISQITVLYFMAEEPDECLHVMPKKDDGVSLNCDRYQKIVRASPRLAGFLTGATHDMTREAIRFTNGSALHFASAQSPSDLAMKTIRILILDEVDKYVEFSGKESDPIKLAMERTTRRTDRKILKMSTPTTERGYINQEFLAGDRRRFHVPCPHCGIYQVLWFGQVKWPEGERDPDKIIDERLAWYECGHCAAKITDVEKRAILRRGVWCPESMRVSDDGRLEGKQPNMRRLSFHLSRLYSTSENHTFSRIAAEFLRSCKFPSLLMNFRNSWLAEVWEDKVDEVTAVHVRSRVGGYEMGTVPLEAHCLTAGVDVQLDHLWYVIRAWGAHGESWLVREGRVEGWEALNQVLFKAHYMAGADPVPVKCVLIDMGYRTDEVFSFARRTGCQPVKGAANPSRSFTVSKHQHADGSASPLVMIDTGYYKAKLHRLIRMRDEDPGSWHLPGVVGENGLTTGGVDEEYYAHVVSEQRVREQDKKSGRVHFPWRRIPAGAANHLLDCEVYALAAAEILDVEHCYTGPPARSGLETAATVAKPIPNAPNPPSKRPRFQQIKSRFFS